MFWMIKKIKRSITSVKCRDYLKALAVNFERILLTSINTLLRSSQKIESQVCCLTTLAQENLLLTNSFSYDSTPDFFLLRQSKVQIVY